MAKRDEHLVPLVKEIDHIICNVALECLVLNVYWNLLISSTFPLNMWLFHIFM